MNQAPKQFGRLIINMFLTGSVTGSKGNNTQTLKQYTNQVKKESSESWKTPNWSPVLEPLNWSSKPIQKTSAKKQMPLQRVIFLGLLRFLHGSTDLSDFLKMFWVQLVFYGFPGFSRWFLVFSMVTSIFFFRHPALPSWESIWSTEISLGGRTTKH